MTVRKMTGSDTSDNDKMIFNNVANNLNETIAMLIIHIDNIL